MKQKYNIPLLPLPYDFETKAVLRQVNAANRRLAELTWICTRKRQIGYTLTWICTRKRQIGYTLFLQLNYCLP